MATVQQRAALVAVAEAVSAAARAGQHLFELTAVDHAALTVAAYVINVQGGMATLL